VDYRNVKKDPKLMQEFLGLSKGSREVPLIVEGSNVRVGYGGT